MNSKTSALQAEAGHVRFYAHGDESQHAPGSFYCYRCKAFHPGQHFPLSSGPLCLDEMISELPGETADNAWQLARSLYLFQVQRRDGAPIQRDKECASILTDTEKARAAMYLARWRANRVAAHGSGRFRL